MKLRLLSALGFLVSIAAIATTVIPMSVERLTRESSNVVYVRAVDHSSSWNPEHTRIFTYTHFLVLQKWKGNTAATITVRQLGGHADGYTMKVAGVRYWNNGEDAVLFLQPSAVEDGSFGITGLMQGDFRVAHLASGQTMVSNGVPEAKELSGRGEVRRYQGATLTLSQLERRVKASMR